MTDDIYARIKKLRSETASAFAAVKLMLDGVSARVQRLEALEERIRELELKLANHEGRAEITGRIVLQSTGGNPPAKDNPAVEVAEKQLHAERWKSSTAVIVALIAGIFGTITSLITLISNILKP